MFDTTTAAVWAARLFDRLMMLAETECHIWAKVEPAYTYIPTSCSEYVIVH